MYINTIKCSQACKVHSVIAPVIQVNILRFKKFKQPASNYISDKWPDKHDFLIYYKWLLSVWKRKEHWFACCFSTRVYVKIFFTVKLFYLFL